jgi:hypothetical protein
LGKLFPVGPAETVAGSVNLIKFTVNAEIIILDKAIKIMGRFDRCRIGPGVVVTHMNPGLVDIGGAFKRRIFPFQNQHPLTPLATGLRGIQTVKTGADDYFIPNDFVYGHLIAPAPSVQRH